MSAVVADSFSTPKLNDMRIGFETPEYLWLLLLLPVIWAVGYRSLRVLGRGRQLLAPLLRTVVMVGVIAALAGVQFRWTTDRVAVVYVLDQSESLPQSRRDEMFAYVAENVRQHRRESRDDLAGVIVFGKSASIEIPPYQDDLPASELSRFTSAARPEEWTEATNLEHALELARSSMPTDVRRRIVVLTDGNETLGRADRLARSLANEGIGIDVVPVPTESGRDVVVEKIDMPMEVRQGEPIEARVVMSHFPEGGSEESDEVAKGRLRITRTSGAGEELLAEQSVEVTPGKNVFPLQHTIQRAAAYTYAATFVPETAEDDVRRKNNRVTAFTHVRGNSRVLLIENAASGVDWQPFADRLRDEEIEVVVQPVDATFGTLAELQGYDAVILADVPRVSGDSADALVQFSDAQVEMLLRNTQQLGAGLLMIGGPDAFGAGGWTGSDLEKAMPVNFEIKNTKVAAVGALSLVIDSSGSMSGEKMLMCKSAAQEAVKMLRRSDYLGILSFDSETREVIPMQEVAGRRHMLPMIARLQPGGGTDMYPAMERGLVQLSRVNASTKHMIVLTDGQTTPNNFRQLTRKMKEAGITVSAVAIGQGADVGLLQQIASTGGGKLYHVLSPKAIPRIVMRETRRVSRPLIYENADGVQPEIVFPHALLSGVGTPPPIRGYVMTTPKDSPLAQVLITAPGPQQSEQPVLAVWQYGLGRAAALTTDGGQRWASPWGGWAGHAKLVAQLVRWTMRPSGDTGNFQIATTRRDDEVQVVVNALDQQDEFLNFLQMSGSVLDPDLQPVPLRMRQTGPGRYVGSFRVDQPGSYFVNVFPGAGIKPLTAGVNVQFSAEYRDRQANQALLERLAATDPVGGTPGELTETPGGEGLGAIVLDPFREGLTAVRSIERVWPYAVLIACCLFVGDVLVRRVSLRLPNLAHWFAKQPVEASGTAADSVVRLDAVKRDRPSTYAAQSNGPRSDETIVGESRPVSSAGAAKGGQPVEELSYTQRLLQAKQRARRDGPG